MGASGSIDKPNELYYHCLNGNYTEVKAMLSKLSSEQINRIESDGNTALHAAIVSNYRDIVELLLENGCSRIILNREGKTAYQAAQTEDIRQLFDRPSTQRFVDENTTESFLLLPLSGDNVAMEDGIPDNWFRGHLNAKDARESQFILAVAQASSLLKKTFQNRIETTNKRSLNELINRNVTSNHKKFRRVSNLLRNFLQETDVNNLLTLYTLETPIYGALQNEADSFTALVYLHLSELKQRAYQGYAYRGGKMTEEDINAYKWALNDQKYILETRTIQSMSKKESVAKRFACVPPNDKRHSVLLVFQFPEHCKTAIDLAQISADLPLLSEYENEEEVTLLPFTLFNVHEIKIVSTSGQYRITLRNVPVPKKSLLIAWRNLPQS